MEEVRMICKDEDCGWCYREDSDYKNGCVGINKCRYHWPEETRIDIIGSNGATGEHYDKKDIHVRSTYWLSQQEEVINRIKRFAGKKRNEVSNPNLTAREAIALADYIISLEKI